MLPLAVLGRISRQQVRAQHDVGLIAAKAVHSEHDIFQPLVMNPNWTVDMHTAKRIVVSLSRAVLPMYEVGMAMDQQAARLGVELVFQLGNNTIDHEKQDR